MSKYQNLVVMGKFNGRIFHKTWKMDVFKHTITVKNANTGKYIRFFYYEGAGVFNGTITNNPDNVNYLSALYSFMSDGLSYIESRDFWDFCNNFGYESYDKNAYKIYTACKSAYNRFIKLSGFNENEFYNFYNEFCENNPDIL